MRSVLMVVGLWATCCVGMANDERGTNIATVGIAGDSECDYTSIQAAINAGHGEIRVVSFTQTLFSENLDLSNRSVELVGGFTNCLAANNNNSNRTFSILNLNEIGGTGINIDNGTSSHSVTLIDWVIRGASPQGFTPANGIRINGINTQVTLENVTVTNTVGSGIQVTQTDRVQMNDVSILNNVKNEGNGGGIHCNQSDVIISGRSIIRANEAKLNSRGGTEPTGRGGGIYANNCQLTIYSGFPNLNTGTTGIRSNLSDSDGAGIYAHQASKVYLYGQLTAAPGGFLGVDEFPVNVSGNETNTFGGGIYLTGSNTELLATGLSMVDNFAGNSGGAIFATNLAVATITRLPGGCWSDQQCNYFFDNETASTNGAGGAILTSAAELAVGNAWFQDNLANEGAAIVSINSNTVIEGSVFHSHGSFGPISANSTVNSAFSDNMTITYSTFVDNNPALATIKVNNGAELTQVGNIIYDLNDEPFTAISAGNLVNDCLYVDNAAGLMGTNIIVDATDPFVDRLADDFHINHEPLKDVCDTRLYIPALTDLDNQPRGYDAPTPNVDGPFDIGADEDYGLDLIFYDGFQ